MDTATPLSLTHGNGLSTLYGHASVITTKAGNVVLQGDIICKVGSTGVSTGPHLHFEVRQDGTPLKIPCVGCPEDRRPLGGSILRAFSIGCMDL